MSKDIDADWICHPPGMDELKNILEKAFSSVGDIHVIPYREYEDEMIFMCIC